MSGVVVKFLVVTALLIAQTPASADPIPSLSVQLSARNQITVQLSLATSTQDFEFFTSIVPPDGVVVQGPFLAAGETFAESLVRLDQCGPIWVLVSRRAAGSNEKGVFVAQQTITNDCQIYVPIVQSGA
jgi:hypothetical protein